MTRLFRTTTVALLGLLPACTGSIGDKPPGDDESAPDAELDPGPMDLRRLTNAEVRNSVIDVLGIEPEGLPDEIRADVSPTGFHNASGPQTINLAAAERYYAAAEQTAEAALTEGTRLVALAGCDVEVDGDPCLSSLAERLGRRLYRRPLASEETAALVALSGSDATPRDAAKTILISVLTSPHFLWKVEIGVPDESGYLTLTGLERASRLSFFLLSSGPDEELLSAAEAGTLDTTEGVAQETRRLLADPRAEATLRTFAREWLTGDRLDDWTRSGTLFPEWDEALAVEMRTEVEDL
ncbi:MAG: DUF1592 domain-containing protein, partial [Myxococcales bacterium]|nr:DUF1592 domain-containing protein [Myxococcales bacterium]